jgi:hypothetical protein
VNAADSDAAGACTATETDGSLTSEQQQQQQQELCGSWSCPRWDGEATVEELAGQQHASFFWLSVAFMVRWAAYRIVYVSVPSVCQQVWRSLS